MNVVSMECVQQVIIVIHCVTYSASSNCIGHLGKWLLKHGNTRWAAVAAWIKYIQVFALLLLTFLHVGLWMGPGRGVRVV